MPTNTLASSFRLCDDEQYDILLKIYLVLWIIIFIVYIVASIREFVKTDSPEKRKKLILEFLKCFPITFIMPFPLAGIIIMGILFLIGAGLKINFGF